MLQGSSLKLHVRVRMIFFSDFVRVFGDFPTFVFVLQGKYF